MEVTKYCTYLHAKSWTRHCRSKLVGDAKPSSTISEWTAAKQTELSFIYGMLPDFFSKKFDFVPSDLADSGVNCYVP